MSDQETQTARARADSQPDSDAQRLEAWYESQRRTSYARFASWFINIAMAEGIQWLVAEVSEGSATISEAIEDDGKVRMTIDEIGPYVEHMIAKYVASAPKIQAVPRMGPDEDEKKNREGARATENLMKFLGEKLGIPKLDQLFSWWLLCTGTAIRKYYWDAEAGRRIVDPIEEQVPVTDEFGLDVPGQTVGRHKTDESGSLLYTDYAEGEVQVQNVSPFRFFINESQNLETADRVCEIQPRTKDDLEEEFGDKIDVDKLSADGDLGGWSVWEKRILSLESPNVRWREWTVDAERPMYLLKEFFERPSAENPDGLHILMVGGQVIERGTMEKKKDGSGFVFEHQFPYLAMQDMLRPTRFHGGCVVSHLVPLQKLLNTQISRVVEYERKFVGKVIADEDGIATEDMFTDEQGEVIFIDPQSRPPSYLQPGQLPAYVSDLIDRIAGKFEDVGGRHDISQGRVNASISSGRQAALVAEKDDTRLGAKFQRWGMFKASEARMIVSLAANHYDEPRQIMVHHDMHGRFNPKAITVLGKDLEDNIGMVPGTEVPQSRESRETKARADWQQGVYGDPKSIRAVIQYEMASGMETGEKHKSFYLAVEKAEGENDMFRQGMPVPPPKPWELHEVELEEHRNFWMGEDAKMLSPEGMMAMEQHIFETMQALNPTMMPGQPGQQPGGGAPPPGAPPGLGRDLSPPQPPTMQNEMPQPSNENEMAPVLAGLPTM